MDEYDIYPNLRDGKRMAKADKIETIVMTVLIILLAALLFCKYFVFETVIVSGPSMQNTLQSDDVLLIKKGQDYDYGDIIVFERNTFGADNYDVIKRVIGLPGDTIKVQGKEVYRNGILLEEKYAYYDETKLYNLIDKECVVGKDEVFVMGDNRWNSEDSRRYGVIKKSVVMGVVPKFSLKIKDSWLNFICYVI